MPTTGSQYSGCQAEHLDGDGTGESRKPRKIILCFDGTDGNFGPQPFTNVLKIYRMLDTSDENLQLCYYQPGVGTSVEFDANLNYRRKLTVANAKNSLDSMFAFTINYHVCTAYMFLMRCYRKGDLIYMFGFSRGAFVARILAGMIERVGLLNDGLEDVVNTAWKVYALWEYAAQPSQPDYTTTLAEEFKKTFSRNYEIIISFQGLFDSVNSAGFLRDRQFPFTARSTIVKHVRHALSLDERRGKFQQQNFIQHAGKSNRSSSFWHSLSRIFSKSSASDYVKSSMSSLDSSNRFNGFPQSRRSSNIRDSVATLPSSNSNKQQAQLLVDHSSVGPASLTTGSGTRLINTPSMSPDIIEKWFPGDHADIGGGWIPDFNTKQFLSDMALRWMLAEAVKNEVRFQKHIIREFSEKYSAYGSATALSHDLLNFESRGTAESSLLELQRSNWALCYWIPHRLAMLFVMKIAWICRIGPCYTRKRSQKLFKSCDFANSSSDMAESQYERRHDCSKRSKAGRGSQPLWQVIGWWFVECVPIKRKVQGQDCKWRNAYVPNFGQRRELRRDSDLHWSVFWRIRYYKHYRPSNLPQYAIDLLKEYSNHSKCKEQSDDTNFWMRLGGLNIFKGLQASKVPECPPCESDDYERVAAKARKWLEQWESDHSCEIPDDLEEVLKTNPDL
ncbi:LANO_0G16424g1_1 [Lachancea nothofagi CBS 11611]|uniref:LANO_0G16424g1_1 n=1 Tax=Lachancea nothofagi CBS 11611 TaxID=1266666 RepID=A0A1G4KKK7_9SACH|nr:LANO_0G16424g1_1 [Lachancea nothofagi CBS 11611]